MNQKLSLVILSLILFSINSFAQVNGNGKIVTITKSIDAFHTFDLNFVADVQIDADSPASLEIIADENIFPYIGIDNEDGLLRLSQEEWFEPSGQIKIKIGAKGLNRVKTSGYSNLKIKNLNTSEFNLQALVGSVQMEGKVQSLRISSETGRIDASQLEAENAVVNVWSHGTVKVNVGNNLTAEAKDGGKIIYSGEPSEVEKKERQDGKVNAESAYIDAPKQKARYISVKLLNNSGKKIDIFVRGPAHKRFSYGIPFQALQKRKENFPVGTKVYLDNHIGVARKLLLTINDSDEDKVLKLIPKG